MPKNLEKIGFLMLPAKNRFHILVLHLKKKKKKKRIIEEKNAFLCTFTGPLPKSVFSGRI